MKKEDVSGIVVYLLIMAIAVVFGISVLRVHSSQSGMDFWQYFFFIIGAILSGVILNAILFELAHRLGAKAGRYQILSTNILGVMWYKDENKTRVKFSSFDGLTGETKILPKKDAKKEPNPSPFLWFGTLFFIIEIFIVVVLFVIFNRDSMEQNIKNIGYFILVIGVVGGMILLYNILPLHLDSMTDGYRLTMVGNAANKIAFNELLRVEYEISLGNTDVEIKTFTDITNFTADLNLNKVYLLLDKRNYQEAEQLIDIILAGKETISYKVYIRARAQKIYINIMSKTLEEAQKYYEEEIPMAERRALSNDYSMVCIRTYMLMSGLLDKSRSETMLAINNVSKGFNKTPKNRRNIEISLFNEALERVNEAHPNWELLEYKLQPIVDKTKTK